MIYWESTSTKKSINFSFTQLFNNNMQVITQAVFMLSINTSKKIVQVIFFPKY